jgi:hypothetical protein
MEQRTYLIGEAVWAACGGYGWRKAVVAGHASRIQRWNGHELEARPGFCVHYVDEAASRRSIPTVEILQRRVTRYHPEGRFVSGERWPEELAPRNPTLRGKDKPLPLSALRTAETERFRCDCEALRCEPCHVAGQCPERATRRIVIYGMADRLCDRCRDGAALTGDIEDDQPL